jgi:hypothetical protein
MRGIDRRGGAGRWSETVNKKISRQYYFVRVESEAHSEESNLTLIDAVMDRSRENIIPIRYN